MVHDLPVFALTCHFTSCHYDLMVFDLFASFLFVHGWEVHLQIKLLSVRVPGYGLALQESLYFRYQHGFESIYYSI